jgi:hypothetical protein
MSVTGLCGVCERAPAEHRCDRCGTLACGTHFDAERGLCLDCAREAGRPERDPAPGDVGDRTHRL